MRTALVNAAKSGVDVRIVTPGIPDKKLVFLLTQSYYQELLKANVKIYQIAKGFIHAKCFVSDDVQATVGTVNMDYRSLCLHFECGVWMYRTRAVFAGKRRCVKNICGKPRSDPGGISKKIVSCAYIYGSIEIVCPSSVKH